MVRNGPPDEVLAGTPRYGSRITSWLGGRMLAAQIPIVSGRALGKVQDEIRETVTLSVPRFAPAEEGGDQIDWRPNAPDSPLGKYGQTLDVTTIVRSVVTAEVWETRIGRYRILDWDDDDDGLIVVKAESMLAAPRGDKLLVPTSPQGTFISEARRIAPAGMGVSFDPALVDRACPSSMSWSRSRLEALQEIADAWPALLRVDAWGQIRFRAPLPAVPTPAIDLHDGSGGTLISAPRSDTRAGAYNRVVVTSSASNAEDIRSVAQVTSGPMSVNGPYGVEVREWSSPLIRTKAEAGAAAANMLADSVRPAQATTVHIAPDPRIELDDPMQTRRGGDLVWGYVTAYDLPLTAADGDERVDVGIS